MGYSYRQHAVAASDVPAISRYEMQVDLTVWTPTRKEVELCDFPPERLESSRNDQWSMLVGMVVLFLYLLTTSRGFTFYVPLYFP
jgi:hypothetical protein